MTVDRAQELGEQFCKEHFPGHQALILSLIHIWEQLKRAAAEILRNPAHRKDRVKEAAHEDR